MRWLAALPILLAAGAPAPSPARAQQSPPMNEYTLSWRDAAAHLYDLSLTFPTEGRDSVDVHLPIWRPGRYVLQNYAANVQELSARSESGAPLAWRKSDLSTWRVATGGAPRVTVRYRYYANTMDAGASLLSPEEAYFNPVNLFMWPEGQIERPLRLEIEAPKDWKVATALVPAEKEGVFTAPDYHTLADSPTIVSPSLESIQFSVDEVPYTIWFQGRFEPGERRERIRSDVERIIRFQTGLFGGAPFDEYFFLFHLLPYPFGHAVEHANSSSYAIQDNAFDTDEAYQGFLGIIAHELFHAWNVKRIRPAALWPYDYTREQLTTLHWLTEGVTSYYTDRTLLRAGLEPVDRYLANMSQPIDALQKTPGRKVVPASLASWDSWISGAAYGQGNPNISINFYLKGSILGFLLDARIRDLTDGARSLDDVFRDLYQNSFLQGRGVPEDGVRLAVERVAGASFQEFFTRYVDGTDELPYDETLRPFGLEVRPLADPALPEATLRIRTRPGAERPVVSSIDPDSPALAAGLDNGDEILAVDGRLAPASGWEQLLMGVEPGAAVRLTVLRRDRVLEMDVKTAGDGNLRYVLERVETPDARQQRLFEGWLEAPAEPAVPASTGDAGATTP